MSGYNLGKLIKIELRDIWLSEASHFTPWLAREENLLTLARIIHQTGHSGLASIA